MDSDEMLEKLKGIDKPIITDYGCFATGIEFKILTKDRGHYCMSGGIWPIEGPFSFEESVFNAAKKLIKADLIRYDDYFGALNENCLPELMESEIEALKKLNDNDMDILFDMAKGKKCLPCREYYMYSDECLSERYFFDDYQGAEDHLISVFTREGTKWDVMDDDELAEWVEELEIARGKTY